MNTPTSTSTPPSSPLIAVIGGGAAGFFGSIIAAQNAPGTRVHLYEKSKHPLAKVRISGGGRCNVTHSCFDPKLLIQNYPRGNKALLGPFSRFQPLDTIEWFKAEGVDLKTESDGRMFPTTDNSETIASCLLHAANRHGVVVHTSLGVNAITPTETGFDLTLGNDEIVSCDRLLLACGSNPKIWELIKGLGHTIIPPVPSLFTFNVPKSPLVELAGISVPKAHVKIKDSPFEQVGPLLITHWGFSGPAVLKLSAWGARWLQEKRYIGKVMINWLPDTSPSELKTLINDFKTRAPARLITNEGPELLPKNLWKKLIEIAGVPESLRWSHLSSSLSEKICQVLSSAEFEINGKSTYKEEFVTSGGVALNEVNFKTMQSKLHANLYFAGEILDIDGVTGGFNFQNAWTTAYIAGISMTNLC